MTSYFISGASSGLGAEMARQLSQRGDSVALAARRTDLLDSLADRLAADTGAVSVHTLDVTDPGAVDRVMRHADAVHGGLDVVVVNAGRGGGRPLGQDGFDRNLDLIATNLIGALAQCETALSLFRPRGHGHLVLMSSLAANRGLPGASAVYSATKAALASLGESLRAELAGTDIFVTTLRPGFIKTELTAKGASPLTTRVDRGVAAMIRAMDDHLADTVVPAWPWRPISWLLPILPPAVIGKTMKRRL